MAKTSPAEYIRQVKQEVSKVVWPTKKETLVTTAMVFVMVTLAAIFFFFVDQGIGWLVYTIFKLFGVEAS